MTGFVKSVYNWIAYRVDYIVYRFLQKLHRRRVKKADKHIYPLW